MKIGVINIGDELLAGKIVNTNQYDLSRLLVPLGHDMAFCHVVGDDEAAITRVLESALRGGGEAPPPDVLILTGGLGPTHDDLTRHAAAAFLGVEVAESADALEWLCAFTGKNENELIWGQRVQTGVPSGTAPLRNPVGTACGFLFTSGRTKVYAFPGVPSELDAMARLHLLPALDSGVVLLEKGLWTWGWPESEQRQALEASPLPEPFRFSSLPGEKGVRISISCLCLSGDRERREKDLGQLFEKMLQIIPNQFIVDPGGLGLAEAVQQLLRAKGATVATAESCTGGGLGVLLTNTPGSSEIFQRGFIVYSNRAKVEMLGVDPEIIVRHGAVSEETVSAMLAGCLEKSRCDYACAITGVAGPGGGSPEKPVGTVWIAVGSRDARSVRRFHFRGDRGAIRNRSCYTALNQLRVFILEK